MRLAAGAFALLPLWLAAGCTPRQGVLRVEDDAYALGIAYEPEAYSQALAGVLAETDGKYAEAARAYRRALAETDGDPELSTRLYHASCFAAAPGDFDEPAARARWIDPATARGYAPAYAATLACLDRQPRADAAARTRAVDGLALSGDPAALAFVSGARPPGAGSAGADGALGLRLEVLVTAHPESNEAQLALAQHLESIGKRLAAATAYATYARRQPSARRSMLEKAEAFFAQGEVFAARMIAGAALDAPSLEGAPLGTLPALGVRLALDEALARRDARAALRRTSRARIPLGEAAAHAFLLGDRALAERLARAVVDAGGPADADASAVLLALGEPVPAHVVGPLSKVGRRLVIHELPPR